QGPAGATIDPTTGLFRWVPGRNVNPGVYDVMVGATDNGTQALTGTTRFTITVANTPADGVVSLLRDINTPLTAAQQLQFVTGVPVTQVTAATVVGNELFFVDDDGIRATALWKTDGTAAGTVKVKTLT